MHLDPALRDGDLHHLLVELGDLDLGAGRQIDALGADADLRARFGVDPERAAGRDRIVDRGRGPGGLALIVKGEGALDEGDPADARRRLFLGQGRYGGKQGECEESGGERAHLQISSTFRSARRACRAVGRGAASINQ